MVSGTYPIQVAIVIQKQQADAYIGFGSDSKSYLFTRTAGT